MNFEEFWNKTSVELKTKQKFKTATGLEYEAEIVDDRVFFYSNRFSLNPRGSSYKQEIEKCFNLFKMNARFSDYKKITNTHNASYIIPIFEKYLTK